MWPLTTLTLKQHTTPTHHRTQKRTKRTNNKQTTQFNTLILSHPLFPSIADHNKELSETIEQKLDDTFKNTWKPHLAIKYFLNAKKLDLLGWKEDQYFNQIMKMLYQRRMYVFMWYFYKRTEMVEKGGEDVVVEDVDVSGEVKELNECGAYGDKKVFRWLWHSAEGMEDEELKQMVMMWGKRKGINVSDIVMQVD
eukprot:TRINITY_DN1297_c0_g4_i1.p1 TRINITY_DN1297_c0_g4~~TRINITY_DN1297_c0_g4_i1.p1  ORF type:complete len:195 (-),score=37.28 TRINITY_DN1297_c0_g4_i1:10-594(-)